MASLKQIKERLFAVNSLKKITNAMHLVASAKLRRLNKFYQSVQQFYSPVQKSFYNLFFSSKKDIFEILDIPKNLKKSVYIFITSNNGLAGSYNTLLFKEFEKNVKKEDLVIVIGNKGISYLESNNIKYIKAFNDIQDIPNYENVSKISDIVYKLLMDKAISSIKVIYEKSINPLIIIPTVKTIIPFEIKKASKNYVKNLFEFEPSPQVVFKKFVPIYLAATIYKLITDAKISEMYSRKNAMENATDNADELIENLNLTYNRQRQAKITQEIIEIATGYEKEF